MSIMIENVCWFPLRFATYGLFLSVLLLLGCGRQADVGPTVEVTGKVTLAGEPVTEGSICFNCPSTGDTNCADLGSDGSYQVSIIDARFGDEYVVYFAPRQIPEEEWKVSEESADAPGAPVESPPPPVPNNYLSGNTSDLRAAIEEDGPRTFDFEVKSQ